MADDKLMRGLGWLSLGLSIPPLLMPEEFGKVLGVGDAPRHRATAVVVGVQELVASAGLLGQESPAWLWYRAGGDLIHIGMLGRALKNHDGRGLE
ncbi:MAG: cyclase, partial [Streptosporangiaceae bacterium]